jgi:lipoprotein-anchoring transpeptidase ErfK/SrfK
MNRDILERLKTNPKTHAARSEPVIAPAPKPSKKRSPLFLPLFFLLGLIVLVVAGWSAVNTPALASILSVSAAATPTQAMQQFWAQAMLSKPAYTPTVTTLPEATSTVLPEVLAEVNIPEASATPGLLSVEIVADTPTPEYAVSNSSDPAAPLGSYNGSKYILVDISEQHLYAYENNALVFSFVASTGMNNATRVGNFAVQSKIPSAYGSTWNIWMPNWLGIYWAGSTENGIHALPILSNGGILWAGFLGRPISYGCIVLGTYESELLYNWADMGTPVEIQW